MKTLIRGAVVYDGLSTEPREVSVGIDGDRIGYVGPDPSGIAADRMIDAEGLVLTPGFIDTHASTGLGYMLPHAADNKLMQGVTTEVIGNCGTSSGPVGDLLVPTMEKLAREIGFSFTWRSLGEWFAQVENYGLGFNIGTYVGHSTLRAGTCTDVQQVTEAEVKTMGGMLDAALADGALGLSTGLVYAPGSFATTEEIIELARITSRHGGIYVSHMRDERQGLEDSIEETLRIGKEGGCRVLVSHLKAAERPNWGKLPRVIERLEEFREDGLEVTFEVYPYTAVSTKLRTFIPKQAMDGGVDGMVAKLRTPEWRAKSAAWLVERETDFDAMVLITESEPGGCGKSITRVASELGRPPGEAVVDVLLGDPDAWIVYDCISQEDLDTAVLWPDSIICSDSWSYPVNSPNPIGNPHPRTYGAFTRFLERYALREERITLGEAVRKITSFPALWLGLENRGVIQEGAFADLVLLEPGEVRELATFTDPRRFSSGTHSVWVNGGLVVERGVLTDSLPGRVLRRSP